jgi:hypothetical protein
MTDSPEIGGPTVSLAEAAEQSALSLATIRRRLKAGKIPGAVRNDDRSWSLPIASLAAEGIWGGTTSPETKPAEEAGVVAPDRVTDLETQLTETRHRAEPGELERDQLRERVEDLRASMRMLEAGPQRRRWRSADYGRRSLPL